jgi:hypothetical protein
MWYKLCKLKNTVTFLKKCNSFISASALLQSNAGLLSACDPAEGYPLLSTNSSQPSLRHPIDVGTLFSSF